MAWCYADIDTNLIFGYKKSARENDNSAKHVCFEYVCLSVLLKYLNTGIPRKRFSYIYVCLLEKKYL